MSTSRPIHDPETLDSVAKTMRDWPIVGEDPNDCDLITKYIATCRQGEREQIAGLITPLTTFPLEYEPRCLAVSRSGQRVAVGTKAGTFHIFTHYTHKSPDNRSLGQWRADPIEADPQVLHDYDEAHAVRGITFLNEDELVIGRGSVRTRLLAWEQNIWTYRTEILRPTQQSSDLWHDSALRLRKIVAVPESLQADIASPKAKHPDPKRRALAILLTHWGPVYCLIREQDEEQRFHYRLEYSKVLEDHVKDAVNVNGHLCVFVNVVGKKSSAIAGRIINPGIHNELAWQLKHRQQGDDFEVDRVKYVAAAGDSVIIVGDDQITAASAKKEPGAQQTHLRGADPQRWDGPDRPVAVCPTTTDANALWAVGISPTGGMVAHHMQVTHKPLPHTSLRKSYVSLDLPTTLRPLHMAVATQGQPQDPAHRNFLILGTRHHELVIAQTLPHTLYKDMFEDVPRTMKALRGQVLEELAAQHPKLAKLDERLRKQVLKQLADEQIDHRLSRLPALRALLVERRLRRDFELPYHAFFNIEGLRGQFEAGPDHELGASVCIARRSGVERKLPRDRPSSDVLEFVTRGLRPMTVLRLAEALPKCVEAALPHRAHDRYALDEQQRLKLERVTKRMLDWAYVLLHRCAELDEADQALVRPRLTRYLLKLDDVGTRRGKVLADFTRKWLKYGNSYAEKTHRLRALYDWNVRGHRRLDAAVYGSRLIRNRVDCLSTVSFSTGSSNNAIRALAAMPLPAHTAFEAAPPHAALVFAAHHDGRITATHAGKEVAGFDAKAILDPRGPSHHPNTSARALAIRAQGDQIIVALSSRGDERDDSPPSLVLARLQPRWTGPGGLTLEPLSRDERRLELDYEPYALSYRNCADADLGICVGNDGSHQRPFELYPVAEAGRGGQPTVGWTLSPVSRTGVERQPPTNATMALHHYVAHGKDRVLVGKNDGRLLVFEHVGQSYVDIAEVFVGAPVMTIASMSRGHAGSKATPAATLVAFGTANGQIGVIVLFESSGTFHEARLSHTLERAPIIFVGFYGSNRLIAVASDGRVQVFDFEAGYRERHGGAQRGLSGLRTDRFQLEVEPRSATLFEPPGGGAPILIVGTDDGHVIEFELRYMRRSAARHGLFNEVCKLVLTEIGVSKADESGGRATPWGLGMILGDPAKLAIADDPHLEFRRRLRSGLRWLRAVEPGVDSLRRLSLLVELAYIHRDAERRGLEPRRVWPAGAPPAWDPDEYYLQIGKLFLEIYRRRPLDANLIKIIWDEVSKLVSQRLAHALEADDEQRTLNRELDEFIKMAKQIDDFRWTWVDQDRGVEASTMIHSFECLFRWPVVVALADNRVSSDALHHHAISHMVRRRLTHRSLITALETLRIINLAMLGAYEFCHVDNKWSDERLLLSKRVKDPTPRFFDLMQMVAQSVYDHRDVIQVTHPLFTEAAQFFALCLLLFPHSSLAVGLLVSESRLIERKNRIAPRIVVHANSIIESIRIEWGHEVDEAALARVKLFELYLNLTFERRLAQEPTYSSLPESTSKLEHDEDVLLFVDANIGLEHDLLFGFIWDKLGSLTAADLSDARKRDQAYADELRAELEQTLSHPVFLGHSMAYTLNKLIPTRARIVSLSAGPTEEQKWLNEAIRVCEQATAEVQVDQHLFEPQRTGFANLYRRWRDHLEAQRDPSRRVLEIARHYSRHIYRPSVDALMAELAHIIRRKRPSMPPVVRPERGYQTSREELLEETMTDRSLHRLVERTTNFVDHVQLNAILIDIANHQEFRGTTSSAVILGHFQDWGRIHGVTVDTHDSANLSHPRPGLPSIWNAFAQEFSRNAARHLANSDHGLPDIDARIFMNETSFCALPQYHCGVLDVLGCEHEGSISRVEANNLFTKWRGSRVRGYGLSLLEVLAEVTGLELYLEIMAPREITYLIREEPLPSIIEKIPVSPELAHATPENVPQLAYRVFAKEPSHD